MQQIGILASAEFLADTEADAFQRSLVDTISSCGRTLLDTINHILDYSKINSFERNWRNVRKPGSRHRGPANRRLNDKEAPPMMNIYATIDVAAITEEVVEGVYAGQIYQDISSNEVSDFSNAAKAEAVDRGISNQPRRKVGKAKEVEVIIDIAHENYIFTTQPGALKRVSGRNVKLFRELKALGCHEYIRQCPQVHRKRLDCCQTVFGPFRGNPRPSGRGKNLRDQNNGYRQGHLKRIYSHTFIQSYGCCLTLVAQSANDT